MSATTTSGERPRLYLIDGTSNVFRAYYAIRNLSSSKGEPTNAVFGFLQMLRKLLKDEQPAYLGIAFDVSTDTHRKDKYEAYKANRRPMPDDLRPQLPYIRQVVEAFRIPLLEMPKFEADDVLGTLAKKGAEQGFEVILVSPDKDLMQLVGDNVKQLHTGRDRLYDAALVAEDFGVPPEKVVDVLALQGDASDNVPGVPGIGEKGARQLIVDFGSLDALLERSAEVSRKAYREGLQQHREQALLSRELVTIHTDLPIELEPDKLVLEEPDWDRLLELCWRLEFGVVARELEAGRPKKPSALPHPTDLASAEEWRERVAGLSGEIALGLVGDVRTGLLQPVGLALGSPGADGELAIAFADFRREGLREAVLESLHGFIADDKVSLIGHDLKEVVRLLGPRPQLACRLVDTMLASYLLRSEARSHDFAAVALDRLHTTVMTPAEAGFGSKGDPFPGDAALLRHAAEQVALPWQLRETLRHELAEADLTHLLRQIEEPLVPLLATLEERGVLLDLDYLKEMSGELEIEVKELEQDIYRLAGGELNLNSPQQLGFVLFEKLLLPSKGKTRKTKQYSTDAETLEELAEMGHEMPRKILRFRELTKLKSTYVDALPAMVDGASRIHSRFNQAVAATGRLSSAHPNLQNIPIRTELGHRIRKAFLASPGYRLVVADYSQIELRVLAHMAEEEVMIDAFRRGEDIHTSTAAAVFGVAPLLVSPDQRRYAKVINFGILYGMSPFGLASRLGIGRKEAEEFISKYLAQYPHVRRFTEATLEEAEREGQVKTLFGRLRRIPDIKSRNWNLREGAKRMAVNAPIQGTAADLLKLAMLAVEKYLQHEMPEAWLLLTVHDELVLEAPADKADEVAARVRQEMMQVAELRVPLEVEVGVGDNWYGAKK